MKYLYSKLTNKTFLTLFLGMSLLVGSQGIMAATYTTAQSGAWTTAATWVGNAVPAVTSADTVIIDANHEVTWTQTAIFSCGALNIKSGASLTVSGSGAFSFTIANLGSTFTGSLIFNSTSTGSKSFGNLTVDSTGSIYGAPLSGAVTVNGSWTNNGSITVVTLGLSNTRTIDNNKTVTITGGFGSTAVGTFNNNLGATLNTLGTIAGRINNRGTINSSGFSGTATTAILTNLSTGVINFTGGSMTASNLVLDTSTAGNTVNYSLSTSQTVKLPSSGGVNNGLGSYSNLIFSNSSTKTIGTALNGTLCTGTLTITGTTKANVTNANISVGNLVLGTVGRSAGTIGFTGSGATTINTTNFATGTGYLNVLSAVTYTTWDGSAWSGGAPTSTVDAIIDGTYSTTTNGAISAKSLTVNATKTLTVNAGATVTVQDAVANNGTLTIENNANLIQVNNVPNTGTVTVNRNSNSLKRLDYTLWSSPVNGSQTLLQFSPLTSAVAPQVRFYTYNPSTNVYNPATVSSPFTAGTGYLIRMPNENPGSLGTSTQYYLGNEAITYNGVFTGTLNNGLVTLSGLTAGNFYAVGNPYPSTISANSFLGGNITAGTLYFWRKTNGTGGSAYSTYTAALGGVAGSSGIIPNGTIQVGQGFIVKASTTSLSFRNDMRESAPTSTQFLKTKKVADKSRLWLDLSDATGRMNQVLVGYLEGATVGVDAGIDGKYFNDSAIALTSIVEGEEYVIQGRPTFDATDVVALGFKTDVAADYTIALNSFDGLFAEGQDVYLVDAVAGKEIDLKTGSYSFTAAVGVDNARFSLKYQKTLKVDAPAFNENSVKVYKNNEAIYVNSTAKNIKTIEVYDVQGRLIAQQKNVNASTATISNLKVVRQVLIVKISADDNSVVTKKVLN